MPEPVALEAWLAQEEGFTWILEARCAADPAERQRAASALAALDSSLHRILAEGSGRGWLRHRQVGYYLLVEQVAGELRLLTMARSVWWLEEQPAPREPGAEDPQPAQTVARIRRSAGYYGR